eukprot:gene4946-5429_t
MASTRVAIFLVLCLYLCPLAIMKKFSMPAEWAIHKRTWMAWPYRLDNWRKGAVPAQHAYASVALAIAEFEPVSICVPPHLLDLARTTIQEVGTRRKQSHHVDKISLVSIDSDDAWMRDIGPTFVYESSLDDSSPSKSSSQLVGIDWIFNAWGGIYSPCDRDAAMARQILSHSSLPVVSTDFVLEGGSIHTDGEGTILTTEECLLHPNRNPSLTKQEIENHLKHYLGGEKVIWLPQGLYCDEDTNGHIDNMCCFSKPGEVLLAWTDDVNDPQYARSLEALQLLEGSTDAKGRPIRVIKLPIPQPMHYSEDDLDGLQGLSEDENPLDGRVLGTRMAGSYINFYICNGGIICPQFGCVETDNEAVKVLTETFPDHVVRPVSSRDILLGGGNIHCITQQEPLPPTQSVAH